MSCSGAYSQTTCSITGVSKEKCSMLSHLMAFAEVSKAGGSTTSVIVRRMPVHCCLVMWHLTRLVSLPIVWDHVIEWFGRMVLNCENCVILYSLMYYYRVTPYNMTTVSGLYRMWYYIYKAQKLHIPTCITSHFLRSQIAGEKTGEKAVEIAKS